MPAHASHGFVRTLLRRYSLPGLLALVGLIGQRGLGQDQWAWVWDWLPYLAAVWAAISTLAYWDKGWTATVGRLPRVRLEWPNDVLPEFGSDWLANLALHDHLKISERVVCQGVHVNRYLNSIDPYLQYALSVRNCSVFDLTIDSITGSAKMNQDKLDAHLMVESPRAVIAHGDLHDVQVRVHVNPSVAAALEDPLRGDVSLGKASIWFTYEYAGQERHACLKIPAAGYTLRE